MCRPAGEEESHQCNAPHATCEIPVQDLRVQGIKGLGFPVLASLFEHTGLAGSTVLGLWNVGASVPSDAQTQRMQHGRQSVPYGL